MSLRPSVIAFDVIETVFSLETLRGRFEVVGLPGTALETWFAQTLRDAFALDATGAFVSFRDVAKANLASMLLTGDEADSRIENVLAGFAELEPHPDAEEAFRMFRDSGCRVITLTNGGAEVTRGLLDRAGLTPMVERMITTAEVGHWKPRREVYLHAASIMGVEPQKLALVAAHPWDMHGAKRAGLITGFVARGKPYPSVMAPPDAVGETLTEVASRLIGAPSAG